MKNWLTNRDFLLSIAVPEDTKTYTAIPHAVCVEEVTKILTSEGYTIVDERYLTSRDGQMLSGNIRVSNGSSELSPCIHVVNSYNKTRKASIQAMAMVLVCKNGMMANTAVGSFVRKHNGNALEEFRDHINMVIDSLATEFTNLEKCMEEMKKIQVRKEVIAQLVGDMFLNEGLINSTQLEILRQELIGSKNFKGDSVWDFYNNCTQSFHDNHPALYDKQHIKFHTYILDKFGLAGSRGLYGTPITEATILIP